MQDSVLDHTSSVDEAERDSRLGRIGSAVAASDSPSDHTDSDAGWHKTGFVERRTSAVAEVAIHTRWQQIDHSRSAATWVVAAVVDTTTVEAVEIAEAAVDAVTVVAVGESRRRIAAELGVERDIVDIAAGALDHIVVAVVAVHRRVVVELTAGHQTLMSVVQAA